MRVFITFICFCLCNMSLAAQQDSISEQIFEEIYNSHYSSAKALLEENRAEIDPFFRTVLEIDLAYWQHITGTNTQNYAAFEHTLLQFGIQNPQSFYEKTTALISLSYQLRYELKRYRVFNALSTRKKTKLLFDELKQHTKKLPPNHQDMFLLYNALFQYFDNYLNLFSAKSKKENCKEALKAMESLTHSEQKHTVTLSRYFLGKTYLKYERNPEKAITYFRWLKTNYPDNKKFDELLQDCQDQLN